MHKRPRVEVTSDDEILTAGHKSFVKLRVELDQTVANVIALQNENSELHEQIALLRANVEALKEQNIKINKVLQKLLPD